MVVRPCCLALDTGKRYQHRQAGVIVPLVFALYVVVFSRDSFSFLDSIGWCGFLWRVFPKLLMRSCFLCRVALSIDLGLKYQEVFPVKKSWALSGTALSVFLLSGCAAPPVAHPQPSKPDPILQSLSESARKIAIAQDDLARMSAAKNPAMIPLGPPRGAPMPEDLLRPVYLHWHGPLEPAVRALAGMIGYRVKVVGVAPGDPVLVSIDTDRMSVYDLVQEIGLQAGDAAGVILNPAEKTMMIIWGSKTAATNGLNMGISW